MRSDFQEIGTKKGNPLKGLAKLGILHVPKIGQALQ
jgi:hypothetical protein